MSESSTEHLSGGGGEKRPSLNLSKKVGPLPTWGWAVVVVAAYLAYRHYATAKAAASGGGTTSNAAASGIDTGVLNGSGSASSGLGGSTASTTNTGASNQSWGLSAITGLIASGKYQASDITTAIQGYLTGQNLSAPQAAIVNDAETQYGPPPTPLPLVETKLQDVSTDFYGNQTTTTTDAFGNTISAQGTKYVSPEQFRAEQNAGKAPGVFDPTGGFYNPGTPTVVGVAP